MTHADETAKFPHPMPSLRDPLPPKQKVFSQSQHQSNSVQSSPSIDDRMRRAVGGLFSRQDDDKPSRDFSGNRLPREDSSISKSTVSDRRRSSSAPPIRPSATSSVTLKHSSVDDSGKIFRNGNSNPEISMWSNNLSGYLQSKNIKPSTPRVDYNGAASSESNPYIVTSYSLLKRRNQQQLPSEPPFATGYQ